MANQLKNLTMWESEDSESENDEQIFKNDKITKFNHDLSPRWQLIEAEDRNEWYKTKVIH